MKTRRVVKARLYASILALIILPLASVSAQEPGGVEASYHGLLGYDPSQAPGLGLGMLEKWCALPNFSFEQQGEIDGWTSQSCNGCHVGAEWNPTRQQADCNMCHESATETEATPPTIESCADDCHKAKDEEKRGDLFTAEYDVHILKGLACQTCHERYTDDSSDHQFMKGFVIDTTEPTGKGMMSCTSACHNGEGEPHDLTKANGEALNDHIAKVACETCHTGLRWGSALASRQWNVFTTAGKPQTFKREPGWLPEYKWYDNTGPGLSGDFRLPILGYTERRDAPGAKIYPFNAVTVDWFVKTKKSAYDDIITVPEVKLADANKDGIVTVDEMRKVYKQATLKTADMNFSINHSVLPAADAFECKDCHSRLGWVLDWEQLGYAGDPDKEIVDDKKPKK